MTDFFDSLLSLEEDFYAEGHALGVADGEAAGRTQGRTFGLEKGFQKFVELGRLQGRCSVWNARVTPATTSAKRAIITSPRVQRNIQALSSLLTNPPFKNDEESVEEVEETLKRGKAKVKLLERMLGEKAVKEVCHTGEQSIEDVGKGTRAIADL